MKPWVNIPALIEQGMTKDEIARDTALRATRCRCSRNGISLRKGGQLLRRKILSLPEAPLPLTETALQTLRQAARVMGVDEARLASDLLETIAKDNLYNAVLDRAA
jgi:hypothetical protein